MEFTQRMATALESSKASADEARRKALAEQQAQLDAEQKDALEQLRRKHDAETARLAERLEAEKGMLAQSLDDIKGQFQDATQQISQLQRTIEDERTERQRREEAFVVAKDQLEREHESDVRREKEASERKILEVMDRANADIKILKQEHLEVRAQYEDRLQEVAREYQALEQRWLNRESRPEDVARIEQLLRESAEKDELVLRTKEEMLYFKREMLNREENYNQKFGRSPNVGVMQVLKSKETQDDQQHGGGGAPKGQTGRAKPTQMRMVNPNGGGTMGMGMGIGGGMGGMGGMGIGMDGGNSLKAAPGAQEKRNSIGGAVKLTRSAK